MLFRFLAIIVALVFLLVALPPESSFRHVIVEHGCGDNNTGVVFYYALFDYYCGLRLMVTMTEIVFRFRPC